MPPRPPQPQILTGTPGFTSYAEVSRTREAAGNITEFSFTVAPAAEKAESVAEIVQTTDTSTYAPPSPGPSGLVYLPASNTVMICAFLAGANV